MMYQLVVLDLAVTRIAVAVVAAILNVGVWLYYYKTRSEDND